MSIVRLLSPKLNLVREVIGSLYSDPVKKTLPNDLSRSIVVFPGKRPAHVLRKQLALQIGSAFIPPTTESIDLFIDFLCREHLGMNSVTIDEFDAVAILFELHKGMQEEEKIGREHFSTLETFYPVGVKIYSELEELSIAAVQPKRLSQAVASVTLASAHALSLLYEPFYADLTKRGFITRAQKYQLAAARIAEIDLSRYEHIVLAGFYAFTQTEETIIRHLLLLENVTMLFQDGNGIHRTLEQLGFDLQMEGETGTIDHRFYESPDAHGQLSALNRILSERYPEPVQESERAAVILPSPENLFPLYHQTLSIYDQDTYNLALGYPLTRTPVYGFLMSLLDVIVTARNGEVFIPKYIQFMLHPYTKNILHKTRADVTRMLVHGIEEDCLRHSARVFRSLEAIEEDPAVIESVVKRLTAEGIEISSEELREHLRMIHASALRPFFAIRSVGEFAAACIGVLQFINDHSTAHRHPYFRPFVQTLLDHLVALQHSLLAAHAFSKADHYLLFVRHFTGSAEVPFTGTPLQGLQVLGFLETRGLQFSDVFMIDVNDDVLPGKVQQDVLLPLTIREQLGLSTYRDQERIKAYLFDVLRRGADTIHLFSINNNEKEKSRFIAQLQWDEQLKHRNARPFNTLRQEYAIDLGTLSPSPLEKSPEMLAVIEDLPISSTALDTYLTCGLQYFYKYVLHLQEKGEVSGDVEQSDVGKIVHAILQEYFSPALDRPLTPDDLSIDRLRTVVQAVFRSSYGSAQFGEQFFAKRQVEKHLAEFIELYQTPRMSGSTIIIEALEQKFETEIDGITFTGNADRIETRNERTYIIDYKTGQSETNYMIRLDRLKQTGRETWKDSIGSLQLVLYVMLYSAIRNVPPESVVPAFIFLGKKDLEEGIEIPLFSSDEQMKEWYPVLKGIVMSLVQELRNPAIPFEPTKDIKSDCPECPYKTICGTQWAEKFSLQ
jgi:ATP-dependent helicase/nuclease subunit B